MGAITITISIIIKLFYLSPDVIKKLGKVLSSFRQGNRS